MERKVTKDPEDSQVLQDQLDSRGSRDPPERRERWAMLDLWVRLAPQDPVDLPDPTELTALKVPPVVWVTLDL